MTVRFELKAKFISKKVEIGNLLMAVFAIFNIAND